jgi:hypothetical protein
MRTTPIVLTAALILPAASLTTSAPPGDLEPKRLPRDTQWVAHLDLDALRGGDLGRELLKAAQQAMDSAEDDSNAMDGIKQLRTELGIDPLVDVKSITVYGSGSAGKPMLQVTTTAKGAAVLDRLRKEPNYSVTAFNDHELHSLGDGDEGTYIVLEPLGDDEQLFVVGEDADRVIDQIRRLHGQVDSLAEAEDSGLMARPSPSSFLFVASAIPVDQVAGIEPVSGLTELVRGGVLELGESEGHLQLTLAVKTASTQDARRLTAVVQGGLALLELALADQPMGDTITEILGGISFVQDKSSLSLSIRCPAEEIGHIIQEALDQ